jgi:hypothetical protein
MGIACFGCAFSSTRTNLLRTGEFSVAARLQQKGEHMASVIRERLAEGFGLAICAAAVLWCLVFVLLKNRRERKQRLAASQREAVEARAQLQARAQATLHVDRGEQAPAALEEMRYLNPATEDGGQGIVLIAEENTAQRQLEAANGPLTVVHPNDTAMGAEVTYAARLCVMSFEQLLRYGIRRQPYLTVALMFGIGLAVGRAISRPERMIRMRSRWN